MSTKLLVTLAFALVALLVACDNGDGGEATPDTTPGVTVSPRAQDETPSPAETPAETATVEAEEVCQPNPDPATAELQVIDEPSAGDTVSSPVEISGRIVAFEATFQVTIYDADGNVIVDSFGTSEQTEMGELAPFSVDVAFGVDEPTSACIWVYEQSMRDGSPINVGQIPVTLVP